jgi:TRAP-type C4-dicarboxylate transport system substrate-binding protein
MKALTVPAAAAALLAAVSLTPSVASATDCTVEAPCVLRIATIAPDNTPWASQLQAIERRIEADSGGRINVRVFLRQRDGEVSLARQCKDGNLEAVGVSTGALSTVVAELGVFELPYLFNSAEDADRVIDNHLFGPINDLLAANGLQLYAFSENGYRDFATSNGTVIRQPSDLAALQMRSQEVWIHEAMYRALGGNPVTIAAEEVQPALAAGTVQGFDNTPLFAMAAGWYEGINTWTVSHHIYQPAVVVYNKAWFDGLPADLQTILLADRQALTASGRREIRALQPLLVQNLSAAGITVYEQTDAERDAFAAATRGLYDQFRSRVPTGAGLLDTILANR